MLPSARALYVENTAESGNVVLIARRSLACSDPMASGTKVLSHARPRVSRERSAPSCQQIASRSLCILADGDLRSRRVIAQRHSLPCFLSVGVTLYGE